MDFDKLGSGFLNELEENNDLYSRVAEEENSSRSVGTFDLEQAKGFLSKVHPRLNISLYDHLADLLKNVIRSKIPDAVNRLEELSLQLKKTRIAEDSDLTELTDTGEEVQDFLKEKQAFYKIIPDEIDLTQIREDNEVDSDDDETTPSVAESKEKATPNLAEVLPDIYYIMNRFSQAGIGLAKEEVFELNIALRELAINFELRKVRFWGKILGLKNDFYVAEAPYQENFEQDEFGWVSGKDKDVKEDKTEQDEESTSEMEEKDEEDQEDTDQNETESETTKEPPIPQPDTKEKKLTPSEDNGTGINEYVYFVCTKLGNPWKVLPFMTPSHITEARYLKRFLIGDLEAQIRGSIPYPGKEAHYLRAQIARITASTYISPVDFYKTSGGEGDEDGSEENGEENEKDNLGEISLNEKYVPKSVMQTHSEGLNGWVHYRKAILKQGRCTPMKSEEENEETEKEEEEEDEDKPEEEDEESDVQEAVIETEIPLLRSLSEDKALDRLKPWKMKLSSKLVSETAILIIQSNLWDGAYTFYDGKTFEHIYIGNGNKFSTFQPAPPIRTEWQKEYPVGDDVTEHEDEEIADSETEEKEHNDIVDGDENDDGEIDENADVGDDDEVQEYS